jgi:hypothetical protein
VQRAEVRIVRDPISEEDSRVGFRVLGAASAFERVSDPQLPPPRVPSASATPRVPWYLPPTQDVVETLPEIDSRLCRRRSIAWFSHR